MRRASERERTIWQIVIVKKKQIDGSFSCVCPLIGSINSRCLGTEPALLPEPDSKERRKSTLVLLLTMNFVKTLLKSLCVVEVVTTYWCLPLSVTEQPLGQMETICIILYSNKNANNVICTKEESIKCESLIINQLDIDTSYKCIQYFQSILDKLTRDLRLL